MSNAADAVARLADERDHYIDRAGDLEALARDMLATFIKTGDGHRARVGQEQIAKWQKRIEASDD